MNEFTATVTTAPWARSHAGMLPAISTCDITQPPKMVPCALVSAGIGTMRRTGISFAGSIVVMRGFYRAALALAAIAASLGALAQDPKPKTYALVAAIGSRFEMLTTRQQTGSHIAAVDREAYLIGGNVLNRLALQGLDQAVSRFESDSKRIYLSMAPARPEIELVIGELRKLDRVGWDRIMVALPANRFHDEPGLVKRMQGFGLLAQPLCQSDTSIRPDRIGSCGHGFRPPSGPTALTPKGEEIAANTFVAPYAFVEIVTLDPRTLAVLDRSANYGHRKLTDETAKLNGIINGDNKEFLARQIVEVVQESTAEAMANGILKGNVDVREKGPVSTDSPPAR